VLTIATRPDARRRGAAAAVLAEALVVALASGAAAMFLEVATDNPAAQALYASQGFVEVGRRPAYYARVQGPAAGALIMRRDLNR
jgi:ribosomal-protein-alanine N-acetyltransferase